MTLKSIGSLVTTIKRNPLERGSDKCNSLSFDNRENHFISSNETCTSYRLKTMRKKKKIADVTAK